MRKQQKPPLYRGYRIRIARPGKPSKDLPIIWSPDVPNQAWDPRQAGSQHQRGHHVSQWSQVRPVQKTMRRADL